MLGDVLEITLEFHFRVTVSFTLTMNMHMHFEDNVNQATNTEDIHRLRPVWTFSTDLGDPCNRRVRGHDSQGEAAALVQAVN